MVKSSFQDSFTIPVKCHYLASLGKFFQKHLKCGVLLFFFFSPMAEIHRLSDQGLGMGIAQHIITPSDQLVKSLLPIPLQSYALLPYRSYFQRDSSKNTQRFH